MTNRNRFLIALIILIVFFLIINVLALLGYSTISFDKKTVNSNEILTSGKSIIDSDNDGIADSLDNCVYDYNPFQEDEDYDEIGDVCETIIKDNDKDDGDNEEDEDECNKDSDCGGDEKIGNEYCSGNDLNQTWKVYSCDNTECNSEIEERTVLADSISCMSCTNECSFDEKTCSNNSVLTCGNYDTDLCYEWGSAESCGSNICSNGVCETIYCYSDSDCEDNNAYTKDTCENAGTINSYCSYEDLKCIVNSDCDYLNGLFGEGFCSTDYSNVLKLFKTYSCANHVCVNSINTSQIIENCGTDSCGIYGNNYCVSNSIYKNRTCYDRGCSTGNCFNNLVLEKTLVQTCSDDEECKMGACVKTESCTNECSSGAKQCSGNGVLTCGNYDSDSCLEWSSASSCGDGKTCVGGNCVLTCTSECVYDSRRCSGNGIQICGDYNNNGCYEWSLISPCGFSQTCNGGYCI